jgi:hypothetical protein
LQKPGKIFTKLHFLFVEDDKEISSCRLFNQTNLGWNLFINNLAESDFKQFGFENVQYFKFLKSMGLLFLILLTLNIPLMVLYSGGDLANINFSL